jgi:hypothetical protein
MMLVATSHSRLMAMWILCLFEVHQMLDLIDEVDP